MLKNGIKQANGGKRPGSGRKPKAYTILKRRMIAELGDEAEKCFDFYIQVRNNEDEPTALRLEAAKRIEERVFGKPTQPLGQDPNMPFGSKTIPVFTHDDNSKA